jgi:diguanylate cyclase (GGDEF)-like protein/PAS domain S-box-containing protein
MDRNPQRKTSLPEKPAGYPESAEEGFLGRLLDRIWDGVYFVDAERRITYWNKGSEAISGFEREQVIGRRCFDNILRHVDQEGKLLCLDGCPLAATIADGKERNMEAFLHHRDGHRVPVTIWAAPISDENGEIVGAVETFRDDTARAEAVERAKQLEEMAFLDSLTGVGNRRFAEFALAERIGEWERYGWPFALLFIDLDHFKQVNDEYGHAAGDQVLRMVARTLQGVARAHDFVGRWGGEEFVMIVTGVYEEGLAAVAERVRSLVERSGLRTERAEIGITVSIGAVVVDSEDTAETLIRRADERMYRSKAEGRNRVTLR